MDLKLRPSKWSNDYRTWLCNPDEIATFCKVYLEFPACFNIQEEVETPRESFLFPQLATLKALSSPPQRVLKMHCASFVCSFLLLLLLQNFYVSLLISHFRAFWDYIDLKGKKAMPATSLEVLVLFKVPLRNNYSSKELTKFLNELLYEQQLFWRD